MFKFKFQNKLTEKVFSDSLINVVASFINNGTRVLLIALLTRYYTKEEFGIWVTITSLSAIIMVSDFGISNILRNKLSKFIEDGIEGDVEAKKYFLSAFYFFLIVSVTLSLASFVAFHYIPLEYLFKTSDTSLKQVGVHIVIIVYIITILSMPFGLSSVCSFSYHETKAISILNACVAILSMTVIFCLAYFKIQILPIAILYFIINPLINIYITIKFIQKRKWKFTYKIPGFWAINFSMLAIGFKFFVVQLLSAFIFNASTLIVSSSIGLSQASEFNLVQKLYIFTVAIYQSAFNPIWAGYANAIHTGNWSWCYKMYIRSIGITFLAFISLIVSIAFFGNTLLQLLGGNKYVSDSFIFISIGTGMLFYVLWSCAITIHNAAGRMNIIAFSLILATILLFIFPRQNLIDISTNSISLFIATLYFALSIFAILEGYFFIKRKLDIVGN